ncbi:cytochrome d ubiquinol oxidase subunit II [Neisseriaceae bacterium TC5R-5]|nr:cytochrome d ubiquinol oxidase subunit II [Neisseriaceae bacterium TC5R-5]
MTGAAYWLPVVFAGLMALSMLIYVILAGYDLGVGLLLPLGTDEQKDMMINSIGPFWDANQTWLVLGVGLLLVAFPLAHGIILGDLYLPVAIMLLGLIVRGVSFEFRVKVREPHKPWWNTAFAAGTLLATVTQGVMLGRYLTGFAPGWLNWGFAFLVGIGLIFAYALLGACWLLMKTSGTLQAKAILWARHSLTGAVFAVGMVSIATPLASHQIAEKWFALPEFILLLPLPVGCLLLFTALWLLLPRLATRQAAGDDSWCWLPFACAIGVVLLAFWGLAYSVFPQLVIGQLDIWQAASSPEALWVILWGAIVVLPVILFYTAFVYRVFYGKASHLTY